MKQKHYNKFQVKKRTQFTLDFIMTTRDDWKIIVNIRNM